MASASYQPAIDPHKSQNAEWILNLFSAEIPVATVWSTRVAICRALQILINKCIPHPDLTISQETMSLVWQRLKLVAGDRGYESVRTAAAKTVADFVDWVERHPEWHDIQNTVRVELPGIVAAETSSIIQAEYRR